MAIKQENKRITITITPQQQSFINLIKFINNCKTNTKAIRIIFELAERK